jgi:hypothetical protein
MADGVLLVDQAILEAQLRSCRMRMGTVAGKWRIVRYDFPELIVEVTASDPGRNATAASVFRCTCDNFPGQGPFVEVWDDAIRGRPAEMNVVSPGVQDAFKKWGPEGGIYRVWQRGASTHNNWATRRPDEAWHRGRTIVFILEKLYELVAEEAACLASACAA